uniref:CSD domain-containing protein n=1 Tax=viral metagenome TaxID=1070528 RepID=A0A6C0EV50_9ZZZZ
MSSESSSVTSAPVRLTGRVKWFNNKTGFGFISVVGGNDLYKDASEIFVHHSAVTVSQEQYRYLVEGEYVEFTVVNTETGTHKFQAGDVRGVKGGKLFCETRREHRNAQDSVDAGTGTGTGAGTASGSRQSHHYQNTQSRQDSEGMRGGGHAARGGRVLRGRGGSGGGGGGNGTRGGYDNNEGGEWMLVRRGRPGGERAPYRPRQVRSDHETTSTSTSIPTHTHTPTPTPASAPVASDDTSSTPRATTATASKKPRQTKPPTF